MIYWWLILPLAIGIYIIFTEPASQSCLNKKCYNSTPPMELNDSIKQGIDKTIETLRKNHTLVGWRRAILIGLITAIPISYIVAKEFPSGFIFLGISFIVAFGAYFMTVWFEYVWWFARDNEIEKELLKLRRTF